MKTRTLVHLNGDFRCQNYAIAGPTPTATIELSDKYASVSISFRTLQEVELVKSNLQQIESAIRGAK